MKKILSLLLVFMVSFGVFSFASEFNVIEPNIEVITNKVEDHQTEFAIQWSATDVKKGEGFTIGFPFDVKLPDVEGVEIKQNDNNYTFIFKEDFDKAVGEMGGVKVYYKDEEAPKLILNGKSTNIQPETPEYDNNYDENVNTSGRDELIKHGVANGGKINWVVAIGADGEIDFNNLSVTDEIGDGHRLDEESIQFELRNVSNDLNIDKNKNIEDIITYYKIEEGNINFKIQNLEVGEYIFLSYDTIIEDFSQSVFSNQLIVEDTEKLTEKVEVKSWGDIDVERPDGSDKPEKLPQVGEFFLKPQYLLASAMVLTGIKLIKEE